MANHALPTTASTYANFVTELQGRIDDAVKESSTATITLTNPPTNLVRWNATNYYWEINTGTPAAPVWGNRSTRYDININGTVGATTANTGAFTTLSTSGVASLGASSTVGGVLITTASNTQTLTNKTLTSPVISSIVNTGTLTLPTSTDTLVGRATTDTLTNKTLTTPRFTTATALQDANGINLISFPATVASAVNYIQVNNSVSTVAPSIVATGSDANISLNLVGKGTGAGIVYANGVELATISGTQTLSNKTLTTPIISSISNSGTVTIPTGTDTLVNLAGTQSLSNKTLTASAFNGTVGATTASTGAFTTLTASTSLNVTGTATATTFSGAGTSLTGTASGLSIGGNAATASLVTMSSARTDATAYPIVWGTTGGTSQLYSCSAVTITSSTGAVGATVFNGAGTGLTGTASSLSIGGSSASCTGNAGTVTNGVYTTGAQTIGGGKTFTSQMFLELNTSTPTYASGHLELRTTDASSVSMGFHRSGYTACQLRHDIDGLILSGTSQTTAANFYAYGNITAYSDIRLKRNIEKITDALTKVSKLSGYTFEKTNEETVNIGTRHIGLIAQEVLEVIPEAVSEQNGYYSVAYGNLVGLLVEAIKELNEKVDALK